MKYRVHIEMSSGSQRAGAGRDREEDRSGAAPAGAAGELGKEAGTMTLEEAMRYRGENESTLALTLATRPLDVRRWCKPGGLEKLSAQRLQQLAKALDGGVLITEDGAEVELYGGKV